MSSAHSSPSRRRNIAISADDILRIAQSQGSRQERADREHVSVSTVYRIDRRLIETGSPLHTDEVDSSNISMTANQLTVLFWYKCVFGDSTLAECADFIRLVCNATISRSVICRQLKQLGFTWKQMKYISQYQDESDRVAFWVNSPEDEIRPGVALVNFLDIVDLDESGFYASNAQRTMGHGIRGFSLRRPGRDVRTIPHYTLLTAIDARVGIVCDLIYEQGTTCETFYAFVVLMLIPSLAGTGRRVITMDRLSAHYGPAADALRKAGHRVVYRPVHSPTFAPVEWVFSYLDSFLQQHSEFVDEHTLKGYLELGLVTLSKFDVMSFMSQAHFYVDGHAYDPYLGQA